MKKYILTLAILLGAITIGGGIATFGYSKNTASNMLGSSVQVLPPYKTINSPFTAVAPRSSIVNYYSPTSIATSSTYYANTFCINNSNPDCITAWPTGGSGSIDLLSQIGDVSTTTLAVGSVIIYDGSVWQSSPTSSLGITGGSGLTSLNGQTGSSQTFASSTSGGLSLFINSATDVHTFTLQPASGYLIPLTASTTEWANTRNTVAAGATNWDIAYADRLKWDGSLVTNASTTNLSVTTNSYLGTIKSGIWNGTPINNSYIASSTEYLSDINWNGSLVTNASTTNLTVVTNAYLNVLNVTGKTTLGLVSTTAVTATTFYGTLTGNASTATALQNNPSDCSVNQFAYQIDASGNLTCSSIDISASTNLGVTATGLELSGDNITLTSGYIIPLSASTTQWANFYNTPSTRIIAGTNLSWSGNTLNASGGSGSDVNWATSTAGSDIILHPVSADYDVMFGDSTATATAPFWWDVSATSTYIGNGGYGDSVIQLGQVATAWTFGHKASDSSFVISSSTALGTNDVLVISKSTGAVRVVNALNASSTLAVTDTATFYGDLVVTTGLADFGGAVLEIPNGTNPTVDAVGKIAINTTAASSSIRWHDGTAERATYAEIEKSLYFTSSTIDKSSISFSSSTATTTFEIFNSARGFTLNQFYCKTDTGTVAVRFGDGTNWTASVSCTASGASGTSLSNNTFTPRENFVVQIGSATSSPNKVTITTGLIYDAD